ncbi:hypothetical protein [Bdellovibrio sp. HCB288]|uniref:hypothetical protein n=1 Tax=Bdellovibrio sp. HCB288 TaxID=3394355 RepID=UPI0039B51730
MKAIRLLITLSALLITSMAMAKECVDAQGNDILNTPQVFRELIEKSNNCHSAVELAKACAWGSMVDVFTAGAAYEVCHTQLAKMNPDKADSALLVSMSERCDAHHNTDGGTMAKSTTAFCHMNAIEFVVKLVQTTEVY